MPMPWTERLLGPSTVVLGVAVAFVVLRFVGSWPFVDRAFRDVDDAMRLVEVRDLLDGQGWFDLHQYRLDPPSESPMHWSRLVDLPIAALTLGFRRLFDPVLAERAASILWPPLTLIPLLLAMRAIACRLGGRVAALPAVYLPITAAPVLAQFLPGRIDHHNVQLSLTMVLIAVLIGRSGRATGVVSALVVAVMLAVGLETLPFVLIAVAAVGLRWVVAETDRGTAGAFGATLAVAVPAIAAATLPIGEWHRPACDALSITYVLAAVAGGSGLTIATLCGPRNRGVRAIVLAMVALAALAAFAFPSTRCLAGPFADVRPEVRALWLDHVTEVRPWLAFTRLHPAEGWTTAVTPLLGLLAAVVLAADRSVRRDLGLPVLAGSLVAAIAITLLQVRTVVYAEVLATTLVAAAIAAIAGRIAARGGSVVVAVLAGTVFASSATASAVIGLLLPEPAAVAAADAAAAEGGASAFGSPCNDTVHYRPLARLPEGLVAIDVDFGPAVLAGTPHSVVAAPYHRMQRGIVDVDRMLRGAPEEAIAVLDRRGVAYVAHCLDPRVRSGPDPAEPGGLLGRLLAGERLPRFEEVPGDPLVRVFRLLPPTAFAGGAGGGRLNSALTTGTCRSVGARCVYAFLDR
jgi:hypothetical protein